MFTLYSNLLVKDNITQLLLVQRITFMPTRLFQPCHRGLGQSVLHEINEMLRYPEAKKTDTTITMKNLCYFHWAGHISQGAIRKMQIIIITIKSFLFQGKSHWHLHKVWQLK
ncbi:hypothetical protein ONE63_007068 [Megalurothrips usitatus]|uniref:Uncharacterized protein n=1 Tax=Megalurothrips usitatus TaxID=439358 RepID=A0AAV7XVR2_9NEOP|nr:hypothetical protein ONE63_007068 [Megalurothrips usitatus]